jgi:DNA adenine methylase
MSDYTSMSRTELAALCKERGLKGYSTKKKEELIAMLTEPKVEIIKPFLKWVGGKTQILSEVLHCFPNKVKNYHEPFLGGGSVLLGFLSKVKSKDITLTGKIYASDINQNLIALFKNIQTNPQALLDEVAAITDEYSKITGNEVNRKASTKEEALTSQESYYYWTRSKFNALKEDERSGAKASSMMLFMNKTCFRGVYREGPNGFNVPFEKIQKNQTILDEEHIRQVSELIKDVIFTTQGFKDALKTVKEGDLVYLDPPYAPETDKSFVSYNVDGFEEHTELFELCHKLPAKVVLSNSDVKLVRDAFTSPKYTTKIIEARRAINSKKPDAKTNEVIITN